MASAWSQRRTVDDEIDSTSPSWVACVASSCELHLDSGTSRSSGGSQARALIPATTSEPNTRGLPERGRSFSPASPSWQNRLRHLDATSTQTPTRLAMSTFATPSAASSTIRARMTWECGAVRDDARSSRLLLSALDSCTSNGERRDILDLPTGRLVSEDPQAQNYTAVLIGRTTSQYLPFFALPLW